MYDVQCEDDKFALSDGTWMTEKQATKCESSVKTDVARVLMRELTVECLDSAIACQQIGRSDP